MPIVILLLAAAAVFGRHKPHEYGSLKAIWLRVHLVTTFGEPRRLRSQGGGAMY